MVGTPENLKIVGAAILIAVAVLLPNWRRARRLYRRLFRSLRRLWRAARNRLASVTRGTLVERLRVVDGDTVDDLSTGIRYRLANIDCPETEDRAKCYRERIRGEQAKGAAEMLVSTATKMEVRPTGKIDRYGRTVAYLHLDGRDFGELMIERGFAVAWAGKRQNWCGPRGGLVALAKACSTEWQCNTCHGQHTPRRTNNGSVVTLPVVYRRKD